MEQNLHSYAEMANAPSEFSLWMRKVGLKTPQAAVALGVSERQAYYYKHGTQTPGTPVRRLMALMAKGVDISDEWPE